MENLYIEVVNSTDRHLFLKFYFCQMYGLKLMISSIVVGEIYAV